MSYFELKTTTSEHTEPHDLYPLPLITICFDPFFKNLEPTNNDELANFDPKSWAYSWTDGFKKDFNSSDMLTLWDESNHKFQHVLKEIIVVKNEGKY